MAQRHGAHEQGGSRRARHEDGAARRGEDPADDFGDWFDSWELDGPDGPDAAAGEKGGTDRAGRTPRRRREERPEEGRLVAFAREYGWRAYAVPVLAVITVFVLINMFQNPDDEAIARVGETGMQAAPPSAGQVGPTDPTLEPAKIAEGEFDPHDLPPGGPYTTAGQGTFYEVGVPGASAGQGTETVVRYSVEVEHGIDASGYGGDQSFAKMVDATLADPRGWINDPRFRFEHVTDADSPTVKIRLTSLDTTAELCGAALGTETSCRTTITGDDTVIINESRWVRGAVPFQGDIGSYRQYVINHEVGHALGFADHVPCPEPNALAPIMMQQTLSLNNAQLREMSPEGPYPDNQDTCRANPWPYPRPAVL